MIGNNDSIDEIRLSRLLSEIESAVAEKSWRTADSKIHEYLRHDPNDPDALMYLGVSRAAQGFEPEGENLLLASLTFNPSNKDAYYHLGIIVLEQGRCILASEAFRKGLTIDSADHALLYQLGRALERLGNHEEAIEAYRKSLLHHPKQSKEDFKSLSQAAIERLQDTNQQANSETCEE